MDSTSFATDRKTSCRRRATLWHLSGNGVNQALQFNKFWNEGAPRQLRERLPGLLPPASEVAKDLTAENLACG